uniref:Uncharacterized protein n=1 Tax=Daphnia magna TaxID=35525 RepID=A0A0P6GW41_9CRUS
MHPALILSSSAHEPNQSALRDLYDYFPIPTSEIQCVNNKSSLSASPTSLLLAVGFS